MGRVWLGNQNKEQESVLLLYGTFFFFFAFGWVVGGGEGERLICLNNFDAKD